MKKVSLPFRVDFTSIDHWNGPPSTVLLHTVFAGVNKMFPIADPVNHGTRRRVEDHHLDHHSALGENDDDNLIALVQSCLILNFIKDNLTFVIG